MAKLLPLVALLCSLLLATSALVTAQTTTTSSLVPAGTSCTELRIRRPWEVYTSSEKTLYINAVKLAMTKGFHQKFIELHVEWASEKEAHQNCLFMYWHRMFLLGYENMLRSLGTEYECVTIPYWDHLSATARRASGQCTYVEGCSPIYQDFGGSKVGVAKSNVVYNVSIPRSTGAVCANQSVAAAFCGNSTPCASCIVRGFAATNFYPAEAYFSSVYQQVFSYNTWANFATAIERGVHNTVHSAVGGVMAYLQSPADPIFYTHHSFIDLLQTVYLKCQLNSDSQILDLSQKGSDTRFFEKCARRTGGFFAPSDPIKMRTRGYNTQWVDVRTNVNNTLNAFFKDMPGTFAEYVDAKDLGLYSYTYMYQGAATNMYTNCADSNTIAASTVTLLADQGDTAQQSSSSTGVPKPITKPPTKYDNKMRHWAIAIYESAKMAGYTRKAADDQMEMILCAHKRDCLGGVADYDPVFRKNFAATGSPRCFTIVKQLDAGDRVIGIPKWKQITAKFFPCKPIVTEKVTAATVAALAETAAMEL